MPGDFSFAQLQEEMKPWVLHNFGVRPASMPLRGIIEEIGELSVAIDAEDEDQIGDAVADCVIFMADYCNAMGYSLTEIDLEADAILAKDANDDDFELDIIKVLGRLCHHDEDGAGHPQERGPRARHQGGPGVRHGLRRRGLGRPGLRVLRGRPRREDVEEGEAEGLEGEPGHRRCVTK